MRLTRQKERMLRVCGASALVLLAVALGNGVAYLICGFLAILISHSPSQDRIPVLAYHSIHSDQNWMGAPDLVVPSAVFEEQMRWLSSQGYSSVTMDELYFLDRQHVNAKIVAIHFDDGYKDTAIEAMPILERYGLRGTVFVSPGLLRDSIQPDAALYDFRAHFLARHDLPMLAKSGVIEIQSHAWSHTPLTSLSSAERLRELKESREFLEEETATDVKHICFPRDAFSAEVIEEALSCGYISYTGGKYYNSGKETRQVSRIYITSSGSPALDRFRLFLEIRVFQGWYWLFPLLWALQRYVRFSWGRSLSTRVTP